MKPDRKFTSILRDLAENSSLHGIPKTVSSKQKPVQVLWCLLFLATFTVFGLQLYQLFSAYYSWPVQTAVSLKFSALQYPAVTFCNMNPVKLSQIDTYPSLKEVINPKVKREKQASNRRKRAAPDHSSVQFTSTPVYQTSYDSAPVQSSTFSMHDLSVSQSAPVQSSSFGMLSTALLQPTPAQSSAVKMSASTNEVSGTVQETASIQTSPVGALSTQGASSLDVSSNAVPTASAYTASIAPSSVGSQGYVSASGSYGSGSGSSGSYYGSGSGSYYYAYDYWGSGWGSYNWYDYEDNYNYSDSYYESSGYLGNYYSGYSENYETNYGMTGFVHDQLFSPKDQWDERIVNFQAKFKNESLNHRENMGHLVKDMVVSVSFASSLQNVSKFEKITTTQYGNCYTMTSPKYIAMRSGPSHGIKLTLNLEMDEYIKNFASGYGIRMVFHEPGTFPLPADEGMTLSPGFETSIGLKMVKVTRLGPPHGLCSDGADFYKKYKIHYSVTACMMFCRIMKTIDNCDCIPSDSPDLNFTDKAVDICFTRKNKECQLLVDLSFDDGSAVEKCNCVSPCKEVVYTKTMSGRRWPNDDYLENVLMGDICSRNITSMQKACLAKVNDTFDPDIYRYNFLRVLIYFEDLNYEQIDQTPLYESVRFLSDIGGAMGLFLGASVLSFVEILQLMLEMVLYLFRAKHTSTAVQRLSQKENMANPRKDSVFPVHKKLNTSVFDETTRNPSPDPHAVNSYS